MSGIPGPSQVQSQTPAEYLQAGFLTDAGIVRSELTGIRAFGIATQLERAQAPAQEVALTLEALKQVLPLHQGEPSPRFAAAANESLGVVSRMLGKPNHPAIRGWLTACVPFVKTEADIDAFLKHFQSVLLQYTGLIAVKAAGGR